MNCPLCNHEETRVLRTTERADKIRRTRQCSRCGHRWATLEVSESEIIHAERVKQAAGALMQAIGAP